MIMKRMVKTHGKIQNYINNINEHKYIIYISPYIANLVLIKASK